MDYKIKFQEALKSLNSSQRDCVLSTAENLQILAGPGSGKTRVLTMRVAYLVIEKGIAPNRIIVVTFTTKAAGEMRKRLNVLIGEHNTHKLLIGTFHAICSRLLHRHPALAGLDPNFTICEPDQCKQIISQIKKDKDIDISDFTRKQMEPGAILGIISKAKSQGEDEYTFERYYEDDFKRKDIVKIYFAYEAELKRQNMVDFDNLLMKCCVLLRNKNNVLANIKSILVDEYQDTNIVQYDLIKLMMSQRNDKTITIVGDPDQSIFGWRSAEPKNFSKMEKEYAKTYAMKMERNYRSTGLIIDAAMHVITQDTNRIEKVLYTNNPKGIPMSLIKTQNSETEAEFVAAEIKKAIRNSKGLIQYKDIAILMRMNFISRQFETTFRHSKIPFTMVGGDRFFDRIEIKDITSYLSFAYNPKNTAAFTRIINVPKRGIGQVTLNKIMDENIADKESLLHTLEKIIRQRTSTSFSGAVLGKLRHFINIILHIRALIDAKTSVADILTYIYTATDYQKHLKDKHHQDWKSRWENLGELLSIAKKTDETSAELNAQFDKEDNVYSQENTTVVDPVDVEPVQTEPKVGKDDIKTKHSDDEDDLLDLTSIKQEIKTEPGIKSSMKEEFEDVKIEDPEFDPKKFGLRDDTKNEKEDFKESKEDKDDKDGDKSNKFGTDDMDPIAEFLEYCSLCSNQKELDEAEGGGGKVTIATIHAAKGLEWPCVFIVSCNDGVIPHSRCDDLQEEGRLLYVAMTRSQFLLYCIVPSYRDEWGQYRHQTVSCFLKGMPKEIFSTKAIEWNAEIRTLLATTVNRPIPDENYQKTDTESIIDIRFGDGGQRVHKEDMGGFTSAANLKRDTEKKANKRTKSKKTTEDLSQKKIKF